MNLSEAHLDARAAAARLPALQASFDLLDTGAGQASVEILDATNAVLVAIPSPMASVQSTPRRTVSSSPSPSKPRSR